MIFVSTSGFKKKKINEIIDILVSNGFRNIELSGGSDYYDKLEEDLINLKEKYNLKLQLHNYFPPPKENFVLNLSSNNNYIFDKSIKHYKKSIDISKKLGANKFAIHAGYLIDPDVSELGKNIKKSLFIEKSIGIERFVNGYSILKKYAGDNFEIYIENNVISENNYKNFSYKNPLLFTDFNGYLELKNKLDFKILLDIAHLKVSCKTLGINFANELKIFNKLTDYIHISGNNGISDNNKSICSDETLKNALNNFNLENKISTIEVYSGINDIKNSYKYLNDLYKKY